MTMDDVERPKRTRAEKNPKMHDLEWPLNVIHVVCVGFGDRCGRVNKVAVFSVHKRPIVIVTYCKIRYVSKFTAASRCSPCDSTAFLFSVRFLAKWYTFGLQQKRLKKRTGSCVLETRWYNFKASDSTPTLNATIHSIACRQTDGHHSGCQ